NQTEPNQILGLDFAKQFEIPLAVYGWTFLRLALFRFCLEAERFLTYSPANDFLQADESAPADEQDVSGIDGSELLVWVFASTLRGYIGDRAFENFQQRLLHSLA